MTTVKLKDQRWNCLESATLVRTGTEMAQRFTDRGNFKTDEEAVEYFATTVIGDVFRSGVSNYERVV